MSKNEKKIKAQVPARTYEPTQRDRDVVRAQLDRDRKDPPPPKVKFVWHEEGGCYGWDWDHPDRLPASLLLNQAIGAKDEAFGRGLASQMADVVISKGRATMGADSNSMADDMNFLVSMVKGVEPKDALEAALAVQMASVHLMTMRICNRLAGANSNEGVDHAERALNKLARTFATQVETLKKYRTGGEQKVTVQHVSVNDNAQAIVGNVSTGGGVGKKSEANPMKRQPSEYTFQKAPRCTAKSKRTGQRCRAPAVRGYNVCRFHGARGGAPKGKANGAWKHGHYSEGAKAERFLVKRLLEDALSLRKLFSKDNPDC